MIGPLLMAGLTDGSRKITANASNLAPHVSDVSNEGLVSLKLLNPSGTPLSRPAKHLHHVGAGVMLGDVSGSNAKKMSATFRMVQLDVRYQSISL